MTHLSIFISALAVAFLVPGPDMLLLLEVSARQGRLSALWVTFGLGLARGAHVLLSALGLAALLRSAPWAFEVVRIFGVAYLVWLAIGILRSPSLVAAQTASEVQGRSNWHKAFFRGLLTNISNPKALLFCSVLLPQFIRPESGSVAIQFLILGGVLVSVGMVFDLVYVTTGASLGRWLSRHPLAQIIQRWTFASLLFAFSLRLAGS